MKDAENEDLRGQDLGLANWTASVRSSGFWSEKVSLFFAKRQMSMVVRSN